MNHPFVLADQCVGNDFSGVWPQALDRRQPLTIGLLTSAVYRGLPAQIRNELRPWLDPADQQPVSRPRAGHVKQLPLRREKIFQFDLVRRGLNA